MSYLHIAIIIIIIIIIKLPPSSTPARWEDRATPYHNSMCLIIIWRRE
jgi:hypothetical protein